MRIIILIILQLCIIQSFSQETNIDNKWLIILSGYESEEKAIETISSYEFETIILNSSSYENLNPDWFINCISFESKEKAEKKSLLLKNKGFNSYVKYSGSYTGMRTASAINITSNSAVSGGNVDGNNGIFIIECGICWSKKHYPNIIYDKRIKMNERNVFVVNITGLSPKTNYYARAYLINKNDTIYGNQISFTTENGLPIVTTKKLVDKGEFYVECVGNIESDGGFDIIERGTCWSIFSNPSINENKTIDGKGLGSYISKLEGLTEKNTYYIRAYAKNENGISYGNQLEIVKGVTDVEGNGYNVVKIGTQIWMAENLKTTKLNDNTKIYNETDNFKWGNLQTPAYCWYKDNEEKYKNKYGALYNGYVVMTHKVCPIGWHIPTKQEWQKMVNYLISNDYNYDGSTKDNKTAKSLASESHWHKSKESSDVGNKDYPEVRNRTGFSALPVGMRDSYPSNFQKNGKYAYWWLSSGRTSKIIYGWYIAYYSSSCILFSGPAFEHGYSIRCIKD
jgi:uncharacterized protein (TIGR02145 family)